MDQLITALSATKDAVALLFGMVILFVTPRVLATFRDMADRFSAEMSAERSAHREETTRLTEALGSVANETAKQTREIERQTAVIEQSMVWAAFDDDSERSDHGGHWPQRRQR